MILTVVVLMTGHTGAYQMAQTDILDNPVSAGEVSIELTEPGYTDRQDVRPGAEIIKDPTVTNTGSVDAYVYLQIRIPAPILRLAQGAVLTQPGRTELFGFEADPSWVRVRKEELETETEYVYAYTDRLAPGQKTRPLFEKLRAASYLEGDLPASGEFEVRILAQAIQSFPWEDPVQAYEAYYT